MSAATRDSHHAPRPPVKAPPRQTATRARHIEVHIKERIDDGPRQRQPFGEFGRLFLLIRHHQIVAHAEHRILIEIGIILGENFGDQAAVARRFDDVMQMRRPPPNVRARPMRALKAALLDLEIAASRDEGEEKMQAVYATSARFYELIFDVAGHAVAWEIVLRLKGRISRLRAMTLATTDRAVPGLTRITNIYDAIAANDPDRAAQAVQDHLTEASAIARRLLDGKTHALGAA